MVGRTGGNEIVGAVAALLLVPCCGSSGVEIEETVFQGRAHFRIRGAHATWYYDRAGGGFSRLVDRDQNDWIAFSKDPLSQFPASAAAGYRGIPNAVFVGPDKGAGHPGFDQCRSERWGESGIRTVSHSGRWAWNWTFDETSATFTMEKADPEQRWWFLYEGPIAGSFRPEEKYWGTDLGGPRNEIPDSQTQMFGTWRWVYFGDRQFPRLLFLAQHDADQLPDTLWYLGSSAGGAASAPDGMVVFGFGRGPRTTPRLEGDGQSFTVGFLEQAVVGQADHAQVGRQIRDMLTSE